MRKLIVMVMVVVLCLCVPVQGRDLTAWFCGDNDAIGVRLGTDISENVEAGISALWFPDQELPEIWGVYGVYHLPDIVQFPCPFNLEFLPETIKGRPYFGGKVEIDCDLNEGTVSPIAGIVFEKILFIEYQFQSFDRTALGESKILLGLRIEF